MPETKTPDEWVELVLPNINDRWKHAVATQLHGWAAHEHQTGAPMQLTEDVYRYAIDAAVSGTVPYEPALSPYAPKPEEPPPPPPGPPVPEPEVENPPPATPEPEPETPPETIPEPEPETAPQTEPTTVEQPLELDLDAAAASGTTGGV